METRAEGGFGHCDFGYYEKGWLSEKYELHCHDFYEVYYFLEGDVDYVVEGQNYRPTPDSILLFAPHVMHGVKINNPDIPYRRYTLHFSAEVLSPERRAFLLQAFVSPAEQSSAKVYFENGKRFHIGTYFDSLVECESAKEDLRRELVSLNVEALLSRVAVMCEAEDETQIASGSDTVSRIIRYLNRHLQEEINLDQLSERYYISKHHLNKIFRKATGTTVYDYLLRKRISIARRMLMNGMGIQEAAAEVGFRDYSVFYRSYVRIVGHAPSVDKKGAASTAGAPPHRNTQAFGDFMDA